MNSETLKNTWLDGHVFKNFGKHFSKSINEDTNKLSYGNLAKNVLKDVLTNKFIAPEIYKLYAKCK